MFDPQIEEYLNQLKIEKEDFTEQEKIVLSKITSELERTGRSSLLDSLWLEDYEEIPVSMKRFIEDDYYLGTTTRNGNDIWPAWRNFLYNELFDPSKKYFRCLFTGAIGIGKSTIACLGLEYILYKLLCLKDPTAFYGLKAGSKPSVALFNVTLTKSFGVAFSKVNTDCMSSEWFRAHGEIIGNRRDSEVFLPGKDVKIVVGSTAEHFLGYDTFCLTGDTMIYTENGRQRLSDLEGKQFKVLCFDPINKEIKLSAPTTVVETKRITELYEIEFEHKNKTKKIRCTGEHPFLLTDGSYKLAKDLTEDDDLEYGKAVYGYVYLTTNLVNGKKYVGKKQSQCFLGNQYLGSGKHIMNAIKKYGRENFSVELLEFCFGNKKELINTEIKWISFYNAVENPQFYNMCYGGEGWNYPKNGIDNPFFGKSHTPETQAKMSSAHKDYKGAKNPNFGRHWTDEQKEDIRQKNKNWHPTEDQKRRMSETHKLHMTPERRKQISEAMKGRVLSPESIQKLSMSLKGREFSESQREKLSLAAKRRLSGHPEKNGMFGKGYKVSGERNGRYGKPVSEETRRRISEARKGQPCPEYKKKQQSDAIKDMIFINNPNVDKKVIRVKKSEVAPYLEKGWTLGRKLRNEN